MAVGALLPLLVRRACRQLLAAAAGIPLLLLRQPLQPGAGGGGVFLQGSQLCLRRPCPGTRSGRCAGEEGEYGLVKLPAHFSRQRDGRWRAGSSDGDGLSHGSGSVALQEIKSGADRDLAWQRRTSMKWPVSKPWVSDNI